MSVGWGDFYRLQPAIHWPEPPRVLTPTLMATLDACPRRWQLGRASFPNAPQPYPAPLSLAAVRGRVVHALVEDLMRALRQAGVDGPEHPRWPEVLQEFDVTGRIERALSAEAAKEAGNPRAQGLLPPALDVRTLRNQVFRHVRASRPPGRGGSVSRAHAVNTERTLVHPGMPLKGRPDVVIESTLGDVIIDLKTGPFRAKHLQQVRFYGLLWWRDTGRFPRQLAVQAADETVWDAPTPDELEALEAQCATLLEDVSCWPVDSAWTGRPGEACRWCEVRPLCDDYWQQVGEPEPEAARLDLCGRVLDVGMEGELHLETAGDTPVSLRIHPGCQRTPQPAPQRGEQVRVLGARALEPGLVLADRWSEVFVLDQSWGCSDLSALGRS